jgi:hypothetical protein
MLAVDALVSIKKLSKNDNLKTDSFFDVTQS